MSRPEYSAPPEIFYNADEAAKYTTNTRMIKIQHELAARCLELLNLPEDQPSLILDVGCGSGLSGEYLTLAGHQWIGFDISQDMLDVAHGRGCEGDVYCQDMGAGVHFKPGTFDGVISVSVLQWLCNQDKAAHNPRARMKHFFTTLYSCMSHGARAVFQFYPDSPKQIEMLTTAAMKAGFTGGVVIDYPNSARAKKVFLCLFAGVAARMPRGKSDEMEAQVAAKFTKTARQRGKKGKKGSKTRDWVLQKKERRRKQLGSGEVPKDTRFTARKRKDKF
eukprot:m.57190 g.57190  ORF g.57190 m.57190 type:complete len:277 (+) comp11590_c0_seq1:245-1075(+)